MDRDPQLGGVTPAKAEAWARAHGRSVAQGLKVLNAALERETQRRADDPFAFGYEPPIWFVASALLEGSPVTPAMEARVRQRTGLDWPAFAERMRLACGFDRPVRELLIMGANRSGKTDWAAKRLVRRLTAGRNEQLVVGAQTRETSRSTQQDRVWHYLPKDLRARNGERSAVFYLNHKEQTGFTFNKVTMDDKSNLRFVTYEQDVNAIMEGPAFDEGWLDEEFGKRWLDALRFRLSSKRGTLIATFTPVSGYTPVVADFLEGMVVTRRTTAYLLPRDGGPPLPWAQLGLSEAEWAALTGAPSASDRESRIVNRESPARQARDGEAWGVPPASPAPPASPEQSEGAWGAAPPNSQASKPPSFQTSLQPPESRPEDCFRWLEDSGPFSEPENVAPNRVFETVPRVARKRDGSAAIIWFLGRDNPYGSPGRVIEVAAGNVRAEESIRRRVYGLATQTRGGRFRFDPKRHVSPDAALPPLLARTMVVDPAPERNWFCLWLGVDERGDVWVYREWPGDYEIPGQGVPGDWAIVSDRRNGVNDGDRGPAQEKFGFGLDKYKAEWARLEGWSDAALWASSVARPGAPVSPASPVSPEHAGSPGGNAAGQASKPPNFQTSRSPPARARFLAPRKSRPGRRRTAPASPSAAASSTPAPAANPKSHSVRTKPSSSSASSSAPTSSPPAAAASAPARNSSTPSSTPPPAAEPSTSSPPARTPSSPSPATPAPTARKAPTRSPSTASATPSNPASSTTAPTPPSTAPPAAAPPSAPRAVSPLRWTTAIDGVPKRHTVESLEEPVGFRPNRVGQWRPDGPPTTNVEPCLPSRGCWRAGDCPWMGKASRKDAHPLRRERRQQENPPTQREAFPVWRQWTPRPV